MSTSNFSSLVRVLDALRVGLHIMFAFLLGFGVLRSLFDAPHSAAVPLFSVLMAGLYVYGTVLERHRARAQVEISNSAKYAWLPGILVLLLMLLTHSQDLLWL